MSIEPAFFDEFKPLRIPARELRKLSWFQPPTMLALICSEKHWIIPYWSLREDITEPDGSLDFAEIPEDQPIRVWPL